MCMDKNENKEGYRKVWKGTDRYDVENWWMNK